MKRTLTLLVVVFLGLIAIGGIGCGGGGDNLNRPPTENPIDPAPIPDDNSSPSPPRNVTAVAGNTSVYLSWQKVYSAVGYNIYQSSDGVTFVRLSSGVTFSENSAVVGNLTNGRIYYFGVSAVDERNNEGGIAYVGGDGRNPKAFPVIPSGPQQPIPDVPPGNFDFETGDRKIMVKWDPSPSDTIWMYKIIRSVDINPYANLPGKNKAKKIQDITDAFHEVWWIDPSISDHGFQGTIMSGFTIPAGPYLIDLGVPGYGLPPSYFPLELFPGDLKYNYELWGWFPENYSIYGGELEGLIPDDDPPSTPTIGLIVLTPALSGTGVGVYLEWVQPMGPENSDIRQYILGRSELTGWTTPPEGTPQPVWSTPIVLLIANTGDNIMHYQDDSVITGKTYKYQVFASDYLGQTSGGSKERQTTIPGGAAPPE